MGVQYKQPRGTKAALDTKATNNQLVVGQVYLITDENRLAVATNTNAYTAFAKQSEAGGSSNDPVFTNTITVSGASDPRVIIKSSGTSGAALGRVDFLDSAGSTSGYVGDNRSGTSLDVYGTSGIFYNTGSGTHQFNSSSGDVTLNLFTGSTNSVINFTEFGKTNAVLSASDTGGLLVNSKSGVSLQYNGSTKLATTSGGIVSYGTPLFKGSPSFGMDVSDGVVGDTSFSIQNTNFYNSILFKSSSGSTSNPMAQYGQILSSPALGLYFDFGNVTYRSADAATTFFSINAGGGSFQVPLSSTGTVTGSNLSGTNTGDETKSSIDTKLGVDGTSSTLVYSKAGTWVSAGGGGGGSGSITASGYTQATNRLLGRSTASTGAVEEITPDATTLSLSGGTLSVARIPGLLTFSSSGNGDVAGASFNGAGPVTISYNSVGAAPAASPTFTGTVTAPTINGTSGVVLQYNGATRVATTSAGANLTGSLYISNSSDAFVSLTSGSANASYVDVYTGATWRGYLGYSGGFNLHSQSTINLNGVSGANVQYNGSTKLAATSTGASVTGALAVSGTITATNKVDGFPYTITGKSLDGESYPLGIATYAFTISGTNSKATAITAATASTVYTIKKNPASPVTIGTCTFGAGSRTGTYSITAGSVSVDDAVYMEGPATADATLAGAMFAVRS